jgi:hypothetical protein
VCVMCFVDCTPLDDGSHSICGLDPVSLCTAAVGSTCFQAGVLLPVLLVPNWVAAVLPLMLFASELVECCLLGAIWCCNQHSLCVGFVIVLYCIWICFIVSGFAHHHALLRPPGGYVDSAALTRSEQLVADKSLLLTSGTCCCRPDHLC